MAAPRKAPRRETVTLKYKGWFGLCPVYYDDPYKSAGPLVIERHAAYLPLFILSEWMYGLAFFCASIINPEFEPNWPLKVTARLAQPIQRTLEITSEE